VNPFSENPAATVASLGEQKLLERIRRWLGSAAPAAPAGMGDDCAVLPATPASARGMRGKLARSAAPATLVTVDPVIYGEHFDAVVAPRDVGRKLLRRNLSDIAAMGGRPRAAVLALALDPRTRLDWLEAFYRGLAADARRFGVSLVGGDLATHRGGLVASLTLLGETTAPDARALTRSGAAVGDFVAVTGRLGGSLPSGRHHSFTPRLAEGQWLARRPEVVALMDLSDGLAKDIHALTPADARPLLFGELLPRHPGVDLRAALTDGEDYELLLALRATPAGAQKLLAAWRRAFPRLPLTVVGQFAPSSAAPTDHGALDLSAYHGFEHFH
jgi:thiamine-monophosphate kinase